MSSFLYFAPGQKKSIDHGDLARLGLADRVDHPICRGVHGKTPNGEPGCCFMQRTGGRDLPAMNLDRQQWRAAPSGQQDSPPYWIGFDLDDPPGPESLARSPLLPGKTLEFSDGSKWHVPYIRNWFPSEDVVAVYTTTLPRVIDVDDGGRPFAADVVAKYRDIWDASLKLHEQLYTEVAETEGTVGAGRLTDGDLFLFAGLVLAVNYRVAGAELSMLRCMSTQDAIEVVRTGLDCDGYEAAVKNSLSRQASEATDSGSGSGRQTADNGPTTGPQLAS